MQHSSLTGGQEPSRDPHLDYLLAVATQSDARLAGHRIAAAHEAISEARRLGDENAERQAHDALLAAERDRRELHARDEREHRDWQQRRRVARVHGRRQHHRPLRRARARGAGRPAARRTARSTRAGPSDDGSADPEPAGVASSAGRPLTEGAS